MESETLEGFFPEAFKEIAKYGLATNVFFLFWKRENYTTFL